jgi:hypothetical protein
LVEFTMYDFQFESTSKKFGYNFHWTGWLSKFILFIHMHMQDHNKVPIIYVPHQKKSFVKYRWRTYNRWQFTLIPVVSSSGMTYANVVSVPTEKHNRYRYNHTSPLIPQVTHVRLMLHEQRCICYKNVFTS